MQFLSKFKNVTHALAVAGGLLVSYAVAHPDAVAGLEKVHPYLSGIGGLVTFLAAIYHTPKKSDS